MVAARSILTNNLSVGRKRLTWGCKLVKRKWGLSTWEVVRLQAVLVETRKGRNYIVSPVILLEERYGREWLEGATGKHTTGRGYAR